MRKYHTSIGLIRAVNGFKFLSYLITLIMINDQYIMNHMCQKKKLLMIIDIEKMLHYFGRYIVYTLIITHYTLFKNTLII